MGEAGESSKKRRRRKRGKTSAAAEDDDDANATAAASDNEDAAAPQTTTDDDGGGANDVGEAEPADARDDEVDGAAAATGQKEGEEGDDPPKKRKRKRNRKKKTADAAEGTNDTPARPIDEADAAKLSSVEHTVYIEGLPFAATEGQVRSFFDAHGCRDVLQLRLPTWQDTGRLRGFGHVVFASRETRTRALSEEVNGKTLGGRYVTVKEANAPRAGTTAGAAMGGKARAQPAGCKTVFVRNLPYEATEDDIREAFRPCGKIVDGGVRVARNHSTNQSKGFAYVEFKNAESALTAVEKAAKPFGLTVSKRPVFVDYEEGVAKVPLFVKWEHFLPRARGTRNLYFVQVGANVGKNVGSGDPIWEYVRPCGWSGAVVEPTPNTFSELKKNYADLEAEGRVVALNFGVSDIHGYAEMNGEGETATIGEINTDRNITNDTEHRTKEKNMVEIVTLSKIWDMVRSRIPPTGVDILVLDVEGNEANILARGGEMPRPRPAWILFEIAHLSGKVKDEIDESLRSQGYRQSADLVHRDPNAIRHNMPAQDRLYELVE